MVCWPSRLSPNRACHSRAYLRSQDFCRLCCRSCPRELFLPCLDSIPGFPQAQGRLLRLPGESPWKCRSCCRSFAYSRRRSSSHGRLAWWRVSKLPERICPPSSHSSRKRLSCHPGRWRPRQRHGHRLPGSISPLCRRSRRQLQRARHDRARSLWRLQGCSICS